MPSAFWWTRLPTASSACSPLAWHSIAIPTDLWRRRLRPPTAAIGCFTFRTAPAEPWWMCSESASRPDQDWSTAAGCGSHSSGLKTTAVAVSRFLMAHGSTGFQPERSFWPQVEVDTSTPTPRIQPRPAGKESFSRGKPVLLSTISNLFSSIPRR